MILSLMSILMFHHGQDRAISAECLLERMRRSGLDISGLPDLRGLIHDARQAGNLIASCEKGYYLPVDLRDALHYVDRQFRIPARDELQTARIQRRRAVEIFGGQLRML